MAPSEGKKGKKKGGGGGQIRVWCRKGNSMRNGITGEEKWGGGNTCRNKPPNRGFGGGWGLVCWVGVGGGGFGGGWFFLGFVLGCGVGGWGGGSVEWGEKNGAGGGVLSRLKAKIPWKWKEEKKKKRICERGV